MEHVGIGLYGENGHQVSADMIRQEHAKLIGVCGIRKTSFDQDVKVYQSLEELLSDPRIGLVCVCSPKRSGQAEDIRKIIRQGKHVYAEKPCVMREEDLDEILELAKKYNVIFCEMAGCMFERPYNKAREIVEQGSLGEIVQIFVQKSYPYADFRPQDENVDGGLLLQNAIYGARFVEHIAGVKIRRITNTLETSLGNPLGRGNPFSRGLKMAASMQMELENGGIASVIANYLNQPGTKIWGNEELRIFGTKGYLKTNIVDASVDVFAGERHFHYDSAPEDSLLSRLIRCIGQQEPFPYEAEYLTHPTRMVIRAKEGTAGFGVSVGAGTAVSEKAPENDRGNGG